MLLTSKNSQNIFTSHIFPSLKSLLLTRPIIWKFCCNWLTLFSLYSLPAEPLHSVSHVMVLPQDHRAEVTAQPCMTPNAMDDFDMAGFSDTGGGGEMGEWGEGGGE